MWQTIRSGERAVHSYWSVRLNYSAQRDPITVSVGIGAISGRSTN